MCEEDFLVQKLDLEYKGELWEGNRVYEGKDATYHFYEGKLKHIKPKFEEITSDGFQSLDS